MTYRDASGLALTDYPRPSLAVDTAVLTVAPRLRPSPDRPRLQLLVLLVRRPEEAGEPAWALPGTFVHERERLADAVARSLAEKAGIRGPARTSQLGVFDDPDRDERGWVISVAHLAVIPHDALLPALEADADRVRLVPASRPGRLPFDHNRILKAGVTLMRRRYRDDPDPLHLLGSRFTMTQLRDVHDAVEGRLHQKDTFRRRMSAGKEPPVSPTGEESTGQVGKPPQVFGRSR